MNAKTLSLALACLALSCVAALSEGQTQSRPDWRAIRSGVVYWYGHELPRPFEITVDGARATMLINGYPTTLEPEPSHFGTLTPLDLRELQVSEWVRASEDSLLKLGCKGKRLISEAAELHRRYPDVYDSVVVSSNRVLLVYVRGRSAATVRYVGTRRRNRSPAGAILATQAQEYARILRNDGALVFGDGALLVPGGRRVQLQAEIAEIRTGRTLPPTAILKSKTLVDFFRAPPPRDELLRRSPTEGS